MKKKILALFLVAAMMLSLAACGDTSTGSNGGGSSSGKKDDSSNAASKQGVFDFQEIEIDLGESVADHNVQEMRMIDNTIYMIDNAYYNNGFAIHYVTADMQGKILTNHVVFEEIWDNSGVLGGGDTAVGSLGAVAGKIALTSSSVTTEVAPVDPPLAEEIQEYTSIDNMLILDDGKLAYIECCNVYNNKTYESATTFNLVICEKDGQESCRAEIKPELPENADFWINSMLISPEGTLFLTSPEAILEVDMTGATLAQFQPTEVTSELYNVLYYKDGMPVIPVWNEDWTEATYSVVDIRKGEVIEEIELPATINNYSILDGSNSGYDLLLVNNNGIYGYNFGATGEEFPLIMDYINSDLATYRVHSIVFIDEENFVGMYNDIVEYDTHLATFVKIPPEEVPDRDTLTLAVYGVGTDIKKAVIDYNQSSDKYRITILDYSQYATPEDYEAGITKLNNDVISGKVPDIINCGYNINIRNFISKGILADFYELMEQDESFNKSDYCENVFRAYEVDGKLYELPTSYYIWTVEGKSSIFGDKTSITWDELAAVQAQYPDSAVFTDMTKDDVLSNALNFMYGKLVNEQTGECHFNSEMFKNILEFANTYPEAINWDDLYADDEYWMQYQSQYIEDRTLLMQVNIYNMYDAWINGVNNFVEEVTPVGFPIDEGMGSNVAAISSYAIAAKSENIDGAWEFVKSFLSKENQLKEERWDYWGIPMLKEAVEDSARFMQEKPYYIDAEGNRVEEDFTVWVNNEAVVIEPASDEEVQKWVDFVLSVDSKQPSDYSDARIIISEEAAAYFSGQKSVEAVMEIIQSRMTIFISENQ